MKKQELEEKYDKKLINKIFKGYFLFILGKKEAKIKRWLNKN
jgi:hypothetical protein